MKKKPNLSNLLTIRDMAEMSGFSNCQFSGYIARNKIKPIYKEKNYGHFGIRYFSKKQFNEIVAVLISCTNEQRPRADLPELLPVSEDRYIKAGQAAEICGISKRSLFRYLSDGCFVKPFLLGNGAYRWSLNELHNWIRTQR